MNEKLGCHPVNGVPQSVQNFGPPIHPIRIRALQPNPKLPAPNSDTLNKDVPSRTKQAERSALARLPKKSKGWAIHLMDQGPISNPDLMLTLGQYRRRFKGSVSEGYAKCGQRLTKRKGA